MLHVACLPFPSHQGTQAAIHAMLRASAKAGRRPALLTYAHGEHPLDVNYEVHRIPDFPRVRSLRSGPSLGKIALDLRCVAELRRLAHRLHPEAIIAHHIEAAVAATIARVAPVYYVAHTALSRELALYFPRLPARPFDVVGGWLERFASQRAAGVAAIAPSLADLLGARVAYLPVPWAAAADGPTRQASRTALGIPEDADVCLYAGNLDRYQGWEHLIEALTELRRARPRARLLVATESDPAPALAQSARCRVAQFVHFCGLSGELARARAHAASDLAWIPRRTEGGLPVKMLDAFGRRVPVVAMKRATAGLPVSEICEVVPDDDPRALADAAAHLLSRPGRADELRDGGLRHLDRHHSGEAFVIAFDAWTGSGASTAREAMPHERHPQAARGPRAR